MVGTRGHEKLSISRPSSSKVVSAKEEGSNRVSLPIVLFVNSYERAISDPPLDYKIFKITAHVARGGSLKKIS